MPKDQKDLKPSLVQTTPVLSAPYTFRESSILKRPRRSLRTILVAWFLLLSVVPVAFVTAYSVVKYEKAIDNELAQRLMSNGREISSTMSDLRTLLQQRRDRYLTDISFQHHLAIGDDLSLRRIAAEWMKNETATSLTFFGRKGHMLVTVFRDEKGQLKDLLPAAHKSVVLADENITKLRSAKSYLLAEHNVLGKTSLILFSKVNNSSGHVVGFIEQMVDIDAEFLKKLKEKMNVELIVLRKSGAVSAATLPDFGLAKKNYFEPYTKNLATTYFEHSVRGEPHGFLVYPISWGHSDFFVALGASKKEAKAVLKNVNYAFYGVVSVIIGLLVIVIWLTSNAFVKPLWGLVAATQNVQQSDEPVEIPVTSETEIGLLTEAFNQMSRNIISARGDLKNKIQELEKANQEIRETQSKLVHNSKMISLGQLVAGVAHELNNPIGFIYSNMIHLKDYSDRLLKYAEEVENDPQQAPFLRDQLDITFIRKDLPKLIASCEDGARRTRDIVLGLRNFSRLEGTQLKEVDLNELLDSTLNLLQGEIKGRIQIEKIYQPLPRIFCFATQISQVFMNILSNAQQAISGDGKIWISTQVLDGDVTGGRIRVSIQDSGEGMPAETLEKIFDPFYSTKEVGQGTGLGLSITYGIVQNHGGDIQVRSQVGVGTEVSITLPTQPDESLLRLLDKKAVSS